MPSGIDQRYPPSYLDSPSLQLARSAPMQTGVLDVARVQRQSEHWFHPASGHAVSRPGHGMCRNQPRRRPLSSVCERRRVIVHSAHCFCWHEVCSMRK